MAEKRYYWLKMKEDYFSAPIIKKLRKIAGGDTFTIIYLKMQLMSIKNEGYIEYEGIEPTFEEEIALKLDEDVDNVVVTVNYLKSLSLMVECNEENKFFLVEASNNIGSEGQSAERKRKFDEKKKQQALQSNSSVTDEKRNSLSISQSYSKSISNSISSTSNKTYANQEDDKFSQEYNISGYQLKEEDEDLPDWLR